MSEKEYYVGLDIGTASVGWAATDTSYNILRAKGKDMWGARMFDEASSAADRRSQRVARRRRSREKSRIQELNHLFAEAISEIDPNFFLRLQESKFFKEDRSEENRQPYALFNDDDYTDKDYKEEYPTIFHLRQELLHPSAEHEKSPIRHDPRLLYLALLNMFKHRGHFLNENLSEDGGSSFSDSYRELLESIDELYGDEAVPFPADCEEMKEAFNEKGRSRTFILENVMEITGITKRDKKWYSVLRLVCGLEGNLQDIFGEEQFQDEEVAKNKKINFEKADLDEQMTVVESILSEEEFELLWR